MNELLTKKIGLETLARRMRDDKYLVDLKEIEPKELLGSVKTFIWLASEVPVSGYAIEIPSDSGEMRIKFIQENYLFNVILNCAKNFDPVAYKFSGINLSTKEIDKLLGAVLFISVIPSTNTSLPTVKRLLS